jgi:lipid-A-disaccharide synthase-like uncharacterized protein
MMLDRVPAGWLTGDIVFILGQAGGLVVYARNLVLLRRERRRS